MLGRTNGLSSVPTGAAPLTGRSEGGPSHGSFRRTHEYKGRRPAAPTCSTAALAVARLRGWCA